MYLTGENIKKDELNVMYELSHFNSYIDKICRFKIWNYQLKGSKNK